MATLGLLAVCGTSGSGKDTVADHLNVELNAYKVSASVVISNEAPKYGLNPPYSREDLEIVKNKMDALSDAPIASSAISQYESEKGSYPGGLIISGLRRVKEIEYIQKHGGRVVFVDAPVESRYQWSTRRQRGDEVGFDDFKRRDKDEQEGLTANGQQGIWLNGVRSMADHVIINDSSIDNLIKSVKEYLGI